ncbi:hypothetical protein HBI30_239080 [Parastagonospora nodorum]|nr:hypothetical protein HBI30_239080 [Parastagonospora nodorum]KAH5674743.1 hypothetical protein HBI21_137580 [Parastagonospora nodorum]
MLRRRPPFARGEVCLGERGCARVVWCGFQSRMECMVGENWPNVGEGRNSPKRRSGIDDGIDRRGVWLVGWDGMGWDGMGWDGMGWDGMGWDGMGWDGMGWMVCEGYLGSAWW